MALPLLGKERAPFVPIEFQCEQCRHRLRTPDDSTGKKSRCPQCGHIQAIPDLETSGATESSGPSDEALEPLPSANRLDESPVAKTPSQYANPFADAPQTPDPNPYAAPYAASMPTATPPDPRATVLPGIFLIVFAAITSLLLALSIVVGIMSVLDEGAQEDDVFAFVFLGITLAVQLLILWGGINMVRRRGYVMAMVGAIVAIAPISVCWCLSVPFGVWALVTLLKTGMREVFSSTEGR